MLLFLYVLQLDSITLCFGHRHYAQIPLFSILLVHPLQSKIMNFSDIVWNLIISARPG
jgi:hypothetical protein